MDGGTSPIAATELGAERARPSGEDLAMARYADGDDAAFGDVYDAIAPHLIAYLARRVRDRALVEDLAQQTFLRMHRARRTFVTGSAVFPWAVTIARRLVIDAVRHDRRDSLAYADGTTEPADVAGNADEGLAEACELAARLQRRLVLLPESQRAAFVLMRFDGLSHTDAARTLGITVTALKLRAHRAYVSLRVALSDDEGDPVSARH